MPVEYTDALYATQATSGNVTGTTASALLSAPGANQRWLIDHLMVTNTHGTIGTRVTIQDEDATVLWEGYAAAVGGGWSKGFDGTPLVCATNKALKVKLSDAVATNGVYACIRAHKERVQS